MTTRGFRNSRRLGSAALDAAKSAGAAGNAAAMARNSPRKPTGEPAWRGSFDVDDPRAQVARPVGDGTVEGFTRFAGKFVWVIKEFADHIRQPGKAHQITANLVKLVETMLWRFTDRVTGKCEATLEQIMEKTRFSRPTVVRLLSTARKWGFIDWVRRTVKTGNAPGEGPQVRQTSNAYFFEVTKLPEKAYKRLKELLGPRHRPAEYSERKGSGPVPRKIVRQTRRVIQGIAGLLTPRNKSQQAQAHDLDKLLADHPTTAWAALVHPHDPQKQLAFNELYGITSPPSASCETSPDWGPKNKV